MREVGDIERMGQEGRTFRYFDWSWCKSNTYVNIKKKNRVGSGGMDSSGSTKGPLTRISDHGREPYVCLKVAKFMGSFNK